MGLRPGRFSHYVTSLTDQTPTPSEGLNRIFKGEGSFPQVFLLKSLLKKSAKTDLFLPSEVHVSIKSADIFMLLIHCIIIPSSDTQRLCPQPSFPKLNQPNTPASSGFLFCVTSTLHRGTQSSLSPGIILLKWPLPREPEEVVKEASALVVKYSLASYEPTCLRCRFWTQQYQHCWVSIELKGNIRYHHVPLVFKNKTAYWLS